MRRALILVLLLLGVFSATPARAQVLLLGEPTSGDLAVEQRVAVSLMGPSPAAWLALRFDSEARVAVVIALDAAELAEVDGLPVTLSTHGFLDALDAATAPRVLPFPGDACRVGADDAAHDTSEPWGEARRLPSEIARLENRSAFYRWLADSDFVIDSAQRAQLDGSVDGPLAALTFEADPRTATAAIGFPAPTTPSLAVPVVTDRTEVPTTLFVVAPGRAQVGGAPEVRADALGTLWLFGNGRSDYAERRDDVRFDVTEQWIVEAALPVIRSTEISGEAVLPSLEESAENAPFESELDSALAEASARDAWTTRLSGLVEPEAGSVPLNVSNGPELTPVFGASGASCPPPPPVAPAPGPAPRPSRPIEEEAPGCYECSHHHDVTLVVDAACSGDSSSSRSSSSDCSGDTSPSSGDSCSGDTSSSSSGDGCSGDTSDSSSSADCSGDTSSSGSGCSGDTSTGGSGCSGDSSSSCSIPRIVGIRRVSTATYYLAALAFLLRRRSKPGRSQRRRE